MSAFWRSVAYLLLCVWNSFVATTTHRRIQACRLGGGATLTPSPPFPLPSPSPFLFPSLSPSLPLPFPFIPLPFPKAPPAGSVRSPGRKCVFSIFWGPETFLAVTILLLFVRTKCQWKLKNAHYLTVILPNCYSSEEVQHQTLKLLFVYRQTIYISHDTNIH